MAKKRRLSYKATAVSSIVGGGLALAAVVSVPLLPNTPGWLSTLNQVLSTLGSIAWLFGTAAGLLALSTPFAKWASIGLALCGVAAALVIISIMTGA